MQPLELSFSVGSNVNLNEEYGGSMGSRVLVVEDDVRLSELLTELLEAEGYAVTCEGDGTRAIETIRTSAPDLVVLDIGLPGSDGFEVCRAVRKDYPGMILMLTARGDEIDEVLGLELGANDYLLKPVAPRRLLARVKALLRRPEGPSERPIEVGALVVDSSCREAQLDRRVLELKSSEFELLLLLAQRAGSVVSRDEMYQQLHGGGELTANDRSIDLRISRIRKVLGDDPRDPQWIKTVHGAGYLLARRG